MAFRFLFVTFFFIAAYLGLGYQLYYLQIVHSEDAVRRVAVKDSLVQAEELRRGQIILVDRDGNNLITAYNRDYPELFLAPNEIKDAKQTAAALSPIVGMGADELEKMIVADPTSSFRPLLPKPTATQINAIRDAGIKGVHIKFRQYRTYPFGKSASHVVGFAGLNADAAIPKGLYGLEKLKNTELTRGEQIRLTIDRNLQVHVEQILAALMKDHEAAGGTIMITDPMTGKIMALANAPDFDPNLYKDYPVKNFLNPAVQLQYEPGSVFKPLTMAAGIDSGAFTPDTTFVDTGFVTLNGKTITNWDKNAYGKITMTNVIEHSVNTGAVFAEQKIGNQTFYEYLTRFGLGQATGMDLPDEINGSLRNLENKNARQIDFATASYGQGTAVTPVQLVAAFGALANGGVLMRPYVIEDTKPKMIRRVISEDTAKKVVGMMESAVEINRMAAIPGYRIAGKTGTAFVPDLIRGGYYNDQFIHTFIGFGPVSNPKFLIYMKLERPQIGDLAGRTVVPVFRDVAEFVLNYYSIPPDKLATSTTPKIP
ncbi:MAG: penicillin-binding protein 2 [Patescibacteria group bacterium]